MQQQCGLQERQSASLARTSSSHAEAEVERLSLHCNLEGKCYLDSIQRSINNARTSIRFKKKTIDAMYSRESQAPA